MTQSRPSGDDSKVGTLEHPCIKIRYFEGHISTFYSANTLKTECVVHWTAERESTGLKLLVQGEILWVNAILVCKFDSFPKSVLSSNWPLFPTLSLISTVHRRTHTKNNSFKSRSNQIKSCLNFSGLEKWRVFGKSPVATFCCKLSKDISLTHSKVLQVKHALELHNELPKPLINLQCHPRTCDQEHCQPALPLKLLVKYCLCVFFPS